MKYSVGSVYLFSKYQNEDNDDWNRTHIKIVDAFEYKNGPSTSSYKYTFVVCDYDGRVLGKEKKTWTESGLDHRGITSLEDSAKADIIEMKNKITFYKSEIKKLERNIKSLTK